MLSARRPYAAIVAALITFSGADLALGQMNDAYPRHQPGTASPVQLPYMEDYMAQGEGTGPCGYGPMPRGMMSGMPMRGHMMQIMFAIADTNGDGALSFDEVMAIHKRIFDIVDANKDGKVTLEEMQAFMHQ